MSFGYGYVKMIHTVGQIEGAITNRHVDYEPFTFGPVNKCTFWIFSEAERYCQNSRDQTQENAGQCWNVQGVELSIAQTVHGKIVPVPQSGRTKGRTVG